MSARLVLLAVAAACLLAGCSAGGDDARNEASPPPAPPADTAPPPPPPPPDPLSGDAAEAVLVRFIAAAGDGDAAGMWELLSRPTKKRLGPTERRFAAGEAGELERVVGSFARLDAFHLILAEPLNAEWGIAAIEGRREVEGEQRFGAYAAALRAESGRWKLELGGDIRLRPLGPDPGDVKEAHPLLAVEISSGARVLEGGLWLDGAAFPAEGGGSDARHFTIFGEPMEALTRGRHSVVAFGMAGKTAAAVAWTFSVGKAGRPPDADAVAAGAPADAARGY